MDMLEQKLRKRVEILEKERDEFVRNANTQIMAYNTAIQELNNLLTSDAPVAQELPAVEDPTIASNNHKH